MHQLLQNLKTGKTELVEEPFSRTKNGHVLFQTSVSLISAGTERMLVEFGNAGYIAKARMPRIKGGRGSSERASLIWAPYRRENLTADNADGDLTHHRGTEGTEKITSLKTAAGTNAMNTSKLAFMFLCPHCFRMLRIRPFRGLSEQRRHIAGRINWMQND